jgi:PAS domain S-box-containing protein
MLNQISRGLNAARDEAELLDSLVPRALKVQAWIKSLLYIDLDEAGEPEWLKIVATWRREGQPLTPAGTRYYVPEFPLSRLWMSSPVEPLLISDTSTDPRVDENTRNIIAHMGIRAMVVIPLTQAGLISERPEERHWVGLVTIGWEQAREFGAQEIEMYKALVSLASPVVSSRRLLVERERAVVDTLYQISRDLNTAKDKDELLQVLTQPAIEAGASVTSLSYIDLNQDGQPEWVEIVADWRKDGAETRLRYRLAEFPSANLFINNPDEPQLVSDVATDERIDENFRDVMLQAGVRGLAVIPLTQAGRWVGLLGSSWSEPHEFSPQEVEIYTALLGLAAPAVDNRRMVSRLEQMVRERTAELEQSRQTLYQILDAIPVRVFWKDRDLVYLGCNRLFAQDAGLDSPQDIVGKSDFDLGWAESAEVYQPDDRRVIDSGEPRLNYEEPQTTPTGVQIWLRMSKIPLRDAEGNVVGILCAYDDINDIKQAEAERAGLQQQVIEAQQQALKELSTPIIPVMERIIVMPLVGSIDSLRARHIMRALLEGIRVHRARVVILDITGVPIIDSGVAAHLDKTIQGARLKGARTIITGVSDEVAEAVVDLGIDWSRVDIVSDLRTGLVAALESMGIRLSKA